MAKYIISITAADRSGIIAGVSTALVQMEGSITAASQTVHQGYFAMIILCKVEGESNVEVISEKIRKQFNFEVHVYVTEYAPGKAVQPKSADNYIVTVLGPDKPGILNKVATLMAERKINVEDLYCFTNENNEFVVIFQVAIPDPRTFEVVQEQLNDIKRQIGVNINIQHENIFIATNEVNQRKQFS